MSLRPAVGLTGNQLKILALLLMTADHIGMLLFPQYPLFRIIGRLAFPIFAYMIAEGCRHTKNRKRYLLTMAGFALVCQLVYAVAAQSLMQCIFVTFSMSIALIFLTDNALRKRTVGSAAALVAAVAAMILICRVLPTLLIGTDFSVDYGMWGVLLPVAIYLCRNKWAKLTAAAVVLAVLAAGSANVQWYSLLSLPLLALYNGKRGTHNIKYLFYIYYPLHLAVLYLLAELLH